MPDEALEERLAAVERALTEEDGGTPDLTVPDQELTDRVETLEEDVVELEAAVEAVRGYVGSVKHVNDDVEKRADAAMAKAEAIEQTLEDKEDNWGGGSNPEEPGERTASRPSDSARGSSTNSGRDPVLDRQDNEVRSQSEDHDTEPEHGTRSVRNTGHETGSPIVGSNEAPRSPNEYEKVGSSGGGTDGNHRRSSNPGRGRIGHYHLDGPDEPKEPDGLLARLREVL